mgnify:CR=1 FL=1
MRRLGIVFMAGEQSLHFGAEHHAIDRFDQVFAKVFRGIATTYGEQGRLEALQDVLGELLADAEEGSFDAVGSGEQAELRGGGAGAGRGAGREDGFIRYSDSRRYK